MIKVDRKKNPHGATKSWRLSAGVEGDNTGTLYRKKEVGHVYLYLIRSDLHEESYGLVEDLAVNEAARGKGIGRMLMESLEKLARKHHCYKIIANSNPKRKAARALYASLGYRSYGTEFRLDL